MSEESPDQEYIATAPFHAFDALLDSYFEGMKNAEKSQIHAQRHAHTSGSAMYLIHLRKQYVGSIFIRASENDTTVVLIAPNNSQQSALKLQFLEYTVGTFWAYYRARIDDDHKLPSIDNIPFTQYAAQLWGTEDTLKPENPTRPQRGDSIDTWLNWRETERKRRKRYTLDYIANEGGFSISTVKKRSAERKPRGTK